MHMFALTDLQRQIAAQISRRAQRTVRPGRYVDISDSFHIYGSYAEEFEQFLGTIRERTFSQRVWKSTFAEPFFEEARLRLSQESD
jgi:thymidylate synthase